MRGLGIANDKEEFEVAERRPSPQFILVLDVRIGPVKAIRRYEFRGLLPTIPPLSAVC